MSDKIFLAALQKATAGALSLQELVTAAGELGARGQTNLARKLYKSWIEASPDNPLRYVALFNCAALDTQEGDGEAALEALKSAIALNPDFLPAYVNLGSAYERAGALEAALETWRSAANRPIRLSGNAVSYVTTALKQIARVLSERHQSEAAEAAVRVSLEIDPGQHDMIEQYVALRLAQCRWPVIEPIERLDARSQTRAIHPLSLAVYTDDPLMQLGSCERYARLQDAGRRITFESDRRNAPIEEGRRLRIGYVSSDLRDHAIGYLMAELFELHDRSKVEIFAYYCGPKSDSPLNTRIKAAVEHWTDIREMKDDEAAAKIAADGIDILVDVNGHTRDSRTGVFARRPAPVQVNWLGFPGTMGTAYHHYIIADDWIVPEGSELYYTEKVLRLPCYQPNDRKRSVAKTPTRAESGLPDDAVVFCCFNGTHKIARFTFMRWMEILKRVPKSLLWLLECSEETQKRLRAMASENGVDGARIVFAPRRANAEHLARYRLADLFLDTVPYGAHTTASDALWMGVPVVTLSGRSFASRVCGSLVRSAGMPELVCVTPQEYVERAIALGNDRAAVAAAKAKLEANRSTCTLFDTNLLAGKLEALYRGMAEEYRAGRLPQPNLANLETYLDAGLAHAHEVEEVLATANYAESYKSRLAALHRARPMPEDGRLWTAADIAAIERPAPSLAAPAPQAAPEQKEPGIEARAALALSDRPDIHPLIRLRDIHDASSAILCERLDIERLKLALTLQDAGRNLPVLVPPGSDMAAWEKHYRTLIDGVDLNMVVSPTPSAKHLGDTSFMTSAGVTLDWEGMQALSKRHGAKAVFFVAADEAYVELYARWYALSILRYCDVPFLIVVHVIGGAGRLAEIAKGVGIEDDRLIYASDRFDAARVATRCFDAPPKGEAKKPLAHLQSVRFERAGQLLRNLELPLFVSDIDLLLQRGVADLLAQHRDADLVLNENAVSHAAGSRITANLLLLNPTKTADHFIRFLAAYLETRLKGAEVTRWIDQLGLILARHHIVIRDGAPKIGYFDTRSDINNVMYPSYRDHPFRFLSLFHGFDTSSLENNPRVLGKPAPQTSVPPAIAARAAAELAAQQAAR